MRKLSDDEIGQLSKRITGQDMVSDTRKVMNGLKRYWWYAGEWHKAECRFILYDEGVCSCDSHGINIKIKELLGHETE